MGVFFRSWDNVDVLLIVSIKRAPRRVALIGWSDLADRFASCERPVWVKVDRFSHLQLD